MQLSSFPPLPGFSSGLPASASTAPAVAAGTPATHATGFGEMLTAQSAATAHPAAAPGHGAKGAATASGHAATAHAHALANGRHGAHSVQVASLAATSDGAAEVLPAVSGAANAGTSPTPSDVQPTVDSMVEAVETPSVELIAAPTIAGAAVLSDGAAQSQIVAPWVAPVVAESGVGEMLRLQAGPGSDGPVLAENEDDVSASSDSTSRPGATLTAFAGPGAPGRAAGGQGTSAPVMAGSAVITANTPAAMVNPSGRTEKTPALVTAAPAAGAQLAAAMSEEGRMSSTANAPLAQATPAVPVATTPVPTTIRGQAATFAQSDLLAGEPAAAGSLPVPVLGRQPEKASLARSPETAAEPMPSTTVTGSSDGAVAKLASPAAGASPSGGEKIAAAFREFQGGQGNEGERGQRNSLLAGETMVKTQSMRLGTNTAQVDAPMAAFVQPTRSLLAEPEAMSLSAVPLTFDALVEEAAQGVEHTNSARKAVDAAMSLLDQAGKGTQRGVNLQFSVSGMDVAVRVEMRDDQVHTTFRTDSPELRAALAQEWQAVVSTQAADRSQKLADPLFTSNTNPGSPSGDSGASQQREPSTRQSQWENSPAFARPGAAQTADAASAAEPLHVRSVRPETTRHLDAVA